MVDTKNDKYRTLRRDDNGEKSQNSESDEILSKDVSGLNPFSASILRTRTACLFMI